MARFESVADLYDRVELDGGLLEAILCYGGISARDLPSGTPLDIVLLWEKLEKMEPEIRDILTWLEENSDEGRNY